MDDIVCIGMDAQASSGSPHVAQMANQCVVCGLNVHGNADVWTQVVWVLWGDPFAEAAEYWAPLHMTCARRLDRRLLQALVMLRWWRVQARGGAAAASLPWAADDDPGAFSGFYLLDNICYIYIYDI
jgi:hypothetical protein